MVNYLEDPFQVFQDTKIILNFTQDINIWDIFGKSTLEVKTKSKSWYKKFSYLLNYKQNF